MLIILGEKSNTNIHLNFEKGSINNEDKKDVKIISKEMKEEGKVPLKLWFQYLNYGCG